MVPKRPLLRRHQSHGVRAPDVLGRHGKVHEAQVRASVGAGSTRARLEPLVRQQLDADDVGEVLQPADDRHRVLVVDAAAEARLPRVDGGSRRFLDALDGFLRRVDPVEVVAEDGQGHRVEDSVTNHDSSETRYTNTHTLKEPQVTNQLEKALSHRK